MLNLKYKKIIRILKKGGVGVMPTDTLYGLVGSAFSKEAVAKIYQIKKRNPKKPLIIIISSIKDLEKFRINVQHPMLHKIWPGKTSIIFECSSSKFKYLHRGTKTLAIRLPKNKKLIEILKKTGPLVAPSTNPEGFPPAKTIFEAKKYFKSEVAFYLAGGTLKGKPSNLIKINKKGGIKVLRGKIK